MRAIELQKNAQLSNPEFLKRIRMPVTIVRRFEVPYLGGTSSDRKRIYLDKHLPRIIDGINVTKYIVIHEKVESTLMDLIKDITYEEAHNFATKIEKLSVEKDGLSWEKYSAALKPYIKTDDKETLANSPDDIDLKPYVDEKDTAKFKDIYESK